MLLTNNATRVIINSVEDMGRFILSKHTAPSGRLVSSTHTQTNRWGSVLLRSVMAREKISGVYEIVNKSNGHRYIGSSHDIYVRCKDHKVKLNNNKHCNVYLQRAWNLYGEESFEFGILSYCPIQSLLYFEQIFLNEEQPEYNICHHAGSSLGVHHSEETKRKISTAKKGKKHPYNIVYTEELRKRLSDSAKNRPKASVATRKKISEIVKGHIFTDSHKEKIGMMNAKIYRISLISPDGEVYKDIFNLTDFCRKHRLNRSCINDLINGRQKQHKGWKLSHV